jgi:hypothetical protein
MVHVHHACDVVFFSLIGPAEALHCYPTGARTAMVVSACYLQRDAEREETCKSTYRSGSHMGLSSQKSPLSALPMVADGLVVGLHCLMS